MARRGEFEGSRAAARQTERVLSGQHVERPLVRIRAGSSAYNAAVALVVSEFAAFVVRARARKAERPA